MIKIKFPKITIVTPSFNQGEYLERTILSIINQNYPNLEYIVIDGGSIDNSLKIIKKYQKHFSYWQSHPDKGQADAVQQGFNRSTGDILCWLNSDDILLPYSLNLIGTLFSEFPQLNWLTSQSVIINDRDQIIHTGLNFGKSRLFIKLGLYHGKCLGFIPQEGTFWTRKLWHQSGKVIPNKNQTLDYQLWCRFAKYSPLVNLETPLAAFRLQPNQKTSSHTEYYREINLFLSKLPKFTGNHRPNYLVTLIPSALSQNHF
jgi:glycosyltransferase involved in cell wall biosynthesis